MSLKAINLREFARDKPCQVRIPGYCNHDPTTSVWMHCRIGGVAGTGQKPPDLCGAIGCSRCHDVLDRREKTEFTKDDIEHFWLHAMNRTMAMVWKEHGGG